MGGINVKKGSSLNNTVYSTEYLYCKCDIWIMF